MTAHSIYYSSASKFLSSTSPLVSPPQKQEEDLSEALSSIIDLMLHSYREQCKRLFTYLAENKHVKINDKKNEVIINGKTYNLICLVLDLIINYKRLESFYSHL